MISLEFCSSESILWHLGRNDSMNYIRMYMQDIRITVSLGTLLPNSRDRQGKTWLLMKQKTARKTTLQWHFLKIQAINLFLLSH